MRGRSTSFIAFSAVALAQTPTPAPAPPEAAATSPVPSSEAVFTGWIDFGYRWRSDVAGNFDVYRSLVNLGSGPKLIGTEFALLDPKHRLFDQIHVRAYDWGDDPYSTLHIDARKAKLYDFNADYREVAYFDALPSYADPLLVNGAVLNEQSFDMRRRFASADLTFLPGNWITPYVGFERDSGGGEPAFPHLYPMPTNFPCPRAFTTGPVTIAAACVWNSAASTSHWNRAAQRSKTIKRCIRAAA